MPANMKKPMNDTKMDLSNAKVWTNNVDTKVSDVGHSKAEWIFRKN